MPYSCRYIQHLGTVPYPYFFTVHSTIDSTVGPTLHAFEQLMDTYPVRPGTWELEVLGTSELENFGNRSSGNFGTWELRNSLKGVPDKTTFHGRMLNPVEKK